MLWRSSCAPVCYPKDPMAESILLTTARVSTFDGDRLMTGASGFFFERDGRLFLVTSRHVLIDKPSKHFPNRIEIELHTDAQKLTHATALSVWLYSDGKALWRQGRDAAGEIDVAVIEIDRSALPATVAMQCFTPAHLQDSLDDVEVGSSGAREGEKAGHSLSTGLNGWLVAIHGSGKSARELAREYRLPEDYIAAVLSEPFELDEEISESVAE